MIEFKQFYGHSRLIISMKKKNIDVLDINSKFISNIFYFFFIATIFNPYVNGITIYLYALIPFFDLKFLQWLLNIAFNIKIKRDIILTATLLMVLLSYKIFLLIKVISIGVSVLYIIYTYHNEKFYLYRYFLISALFAMIQFVLLFINPTLSYLLGPTSLSHLILGNYAGPTFTNFYSIVLIPRVSGLSREGGFFASLVVVMILIYTIDPYKGRIIKIIKPFLFISYIISLSKSSLGIISVVLTKFKKSFLKIPFSLVSLFILFIFSMQFIISPLVIKYSLTNEIKESLLHRFGGYYLLNFLSINDFLFGVKNMKCYSNLYFVNEVWYFVKNGNWTGWAFLLINYGFIFSVLTIALMEILGLTILDFIIITTLTFNTSPLTVSNQVVLVYFTIYLLHLRRKSKKRNSYGLIN